MHFGILAHDVIEVRHQSAQANRYSPQLSYPYELSFEVAVCSAAIVLLLKRAAQVWCC